MSSTENKAQMRKKKREDILKFASIRRKSREEVFKCVFSMEFNEDYLPTEYGVKEEIAANEDVTATESIDVVMEENVCEIPAEEIITKEVEEDQEAVADTSEDDEEEKEALDDAYIKATIDGIFNNREEIDAIISSSIRGRSFDRLSKQVVGILRLGVYEICFNNEIPPVTAINESVKIADVYCDDAEVTYINGVLNGIYKSRVQEK